MTRDMVDDDEYDAYDLSEFSPADFVHIDATTRERDNNPIRPALVPGSGSGRRRVGSATSGSGGPQIAVALDSAADESVVVKVAGEDNTVISVADDTTRGDSDAGTARSPFETHRQNGTLSVSDLVGPAWCEVQFDYGLRQGRSFALAQRPNSFVSAEGKEIMVDKNVAKVNEKVLGRGRSVHKELESELNPEVVVVKTHSKVDYWAVYLVNMLACLDQLMQLDCCREMPVFGTVQGQPIIGIIDEILLKTIPEPEAESSTRKKRAPTATPGTPRSSKKRREPSPSQSHVTASPPRAEASRSASPIRAMVHELSLIDTKTRRSNSLPSDDDSFPSRMQLMLYHHLLSALLSPAFSFCAFWEKIDVDPFERLSDEFLLQSGLAARDAIDGKVSPGCYPACLGDLASLWRSKVLLLRVRGVSPTLEIAYRTQKPKRGAAHDDDFATARREERDIARAIEASLREHEHDLDLERAIAESLQDVTTSEEDGGATLASAEQPSDMPQVRWYAQSGQSEVVEGAAPHIGECGTADLGGPSGSHVPPSQPEKSRIIGWKSFDFDEAAMHVYVQDVLRWWRGERLPRGVDVEHSRRCFSCEYRGGCEWREMKAKEAREKFCGPNRSRFEIT